MESSASEKNQWNNLFKVAGFAAILVVAYVPFQMAVFMINPPPATITGWFDLFKKNILVGLIDLDATHLLSDYDTFSF